jgi:hypothetical protein
VEDSGDDEGMMGIVVPRADAAAALQIIAAAAPASRATSRTMLGGRKTPKPFFFSTEGGRCFADVLAKGGCNRHVFFYSGVKKSDGPHLES